MSQRASHAIETRNAVAAKCDCSQYYAEFLSVLTKQLKDEANQTPLKPLYQLKFALQCPEG